MKRKPLTVDGHKCSINWDKESLFINCENELIFILYANEPSLRTMFYKLTGRVSGEYLERVGFQSA